MLFYRFVLLISNTVCYSGDAICKKNMGEWKNISLKRRIVEGLGWSLYDKKIRKKVSFRIHSVKYD